MLIKVVSAAICIGYVALAADASADLRDTPSAPHGLFEAKAEYTGPVATRIAVLHEEYSGAFSLHFNRDATRIAIDADTVKIKIWDWRKKQIVKTIDRGTASSLGTNPLQYSPDGRLLASCNEVGGGNSVNRIWNTADWSIAKDLLDPQAMECAAINFTPDGRFLIRLTSRLGTTHEDNFQVLSTFDWQVVWGLRVDSFMPESVAVSPDGKRAVFGGLRVGLSTDTGQEDRSVLNVVDLASRKIVHVIKGKALGPITWSPDGIRFAVAGGGHVAIYNADSGGAVVDEALPESAHMHIQYTADGRYLIESDSNGRGTGLGINIWDSQRHTLLQHIPGNIVSLDVSGDSKFIAAGGTGRTVIWQLK
jgi:WD40 repeat protein